MKKLRQISLPQDHPGGLGGYAQRQSVMLHKYLREIQEQINSIIETVDGDGYAFAPLSTGVEPLELVSDGYGQCVMVPYNH